MIIMRKRNIMSLLLAFCLCFAMAMPAFATETDTLSLTPLDEVENLEVLVEADESAETFVENDTLADASEDGIEPYAISRDEVIIKEVRVYPIVYCVEDQAAYILNNVSRVRRWGSNLVVADGSIHLFPADVTAFVNEAFNVLNNNSETAGKQWGVIGWRIETEHDLIAAKPLRLTWTPTATCMDGTETRTQSINQTNTHITIRGNYGLPADPNSYYYAGINGVFYCRYTTGNNAGQQYGIPMGGGVMMNAKV